MLPLLMTGGVAQVLTTIEQTQMAKLEQDGYETSKEVGGSFLVSFGKKESEEYDRERYRNFTRYTKNIQATIMGGEPFDVIQEENEKENPSDCSQSSSKLAEWMRSISHNPIVIRFNMVPIINLLNSQRFPSDPWIAQKRAAMQVTLDKFASGRQVRCIRDCSGHGDCVQMSSGSSSGLFNLGSCKCDEGFVGAACATPLSVTTPIRPNLV